MSRVYSRSSGHRHRCVGDVGEDRFLVQVVADHVRYIGIHALVVGDTGTRRVGEGHIAQLVGVQQTRNAEQGVLAERQRIEKVVVHAPVDDIHAPQSPGGSHVDKSVVHHEIAALHQFGPDLVGKKHVFVEGRVVHARREEHHAGIGSSIGRELAQGFEQQASIVLDFVHAAAPVKPPQACLYRLAIGDHVGDAGRYAQIVFQHVEAIVGTHDIAAADRDPKPPPGHARPASRTGIGGQSRTITAGMTPSATMRASL